MAKSTSTRVTLPPESTQWGRRVNRQAVQSDLALSNLRTNATSTNAQLGGLTRQTRAQAETVQTLNDLVNELKKQETWVIAPDVIAENRIEQVGFFRLPVDTGADLRGTHTTGATGQVNGLVQFSLSGYMWSGSPGFDAGFIVSYILNISPASAPGAPVFTAGFSVGWNKLIEQQHFDGMVVTRAVHLELDPNVEYIVQTRREIETYVVGDDPEVIELYVHWTAGSLQLRNEI